MNESKINLECTSCHAVFTCVSSDVKLDTKKEQEEKEKIKTWREYGIKQLKEERKLLKENTRELRELEESLSKLSFFNRVEIKEHREKIEILEDSRAYIKQEILFWQSRNEQNELKKVYKIYGVKCPLCNYSNVINKK